MKKPQDLDAVIEVYTRKRDDMLQSLGHAQRELQQAQQQMDQLQSYAAESQQRWLQRATGGVSPTLILTQRQFMAKLDHAITFQNGVMQRLQLSIDNCQQLLLQAERELAGIHKYIERRTQQWQHQLQRQEQRHNDEMAANLHRQTAHTSAPWRHST